MHLLRQVTAGLLVVLALVLALRPAPPAGPAGPVTVPVVVAATDLSAGAVLRESDLVLADLPAQLAPDGSNAEGAELAGRVLAAPLRRGEPVTDVRVVGPGLWSQVPAGQVAAPVRLADLAVAALLRPGDRVDVLATAPETGVADVVAADALVLGVTPDAAAGPPAGAPTAAAGLLVLAVPPETARVLAGAATTSSLTATLGRP